MKKNIIVLVTLMAVTIATLKQFYFGCIAAVQTPLSAAWCKKNS